MNGSFYLSPAKQEKMSAGAVEVSRFGTQAFTADDFHFPSSMIC